VVVGSRFVRAIREAAAGGSEAVRRAAREACRELAGP
jgi:tryptophan synthase alpha subunit